MEINDSSKIRLNEWITPKGKNYSYQIWWPSCDPYDPECEEVDIIVKHQEQEYATTLLTTKFIDSIMEKNRTTGECANGSYLTMSKTIMVRRINEETIEKTLEDLIKQYSRLPDEVFNLSSI